ncbi:MAG TPA: UDP-2,3-diacylglucosamine diphosphatase LpxI [Candidatus Limnocylindria bacterium]|nr:UDP-2,3-diacylglucosamine diphosphatase LpxI [Candidatus Limnocylindria bacterium]
MTEQIETLGIIAGDRSLPLLLAQQARALGVRKLIAIGFEDQSNRDLEPLVDKMIWMKLGQLTKLIDAFHAHGVRHCVMVGKIAPKSFFDVRPDLRVTMAVLKLKEKNAHTLFGAFADELQKDGIELVPATRWLKPIMPGAGFHIGPKLSDEQRADVEFGFRIAKEISRLEIGQSVVVKNGAVLAVEGFEGTDKCLQRGGELSGKDGGAVAVKVAKEKHDMRWDIPCVGEQTLQTCAAARLSVLAIEADKTLLLDRERVEVLAKKNKIAVVSVG